MKINAEKSQLLNSPCTSYWLKDAIKALDKRDPVDAMHDVETLIRLFGLEANVNEVVKVI